MHRQKKMVLSWLMEAYRENVSFDRLSTSMCMLNETAILLSCTLEVGMRVLYKIFPLFTDKGKVKLCQFGTCVPVVSILNEIVFFTSCFVYRWRHGEDRHPVRELLYESKIYNPEEIARERRHGA